MWACPEMQDRNRFYVLFECHSSSVSYPASTFCYQWSLEMAFRLTKVLCMCYRSCSLCSTRLDNLAKTTGSSLSLSWHGWDEVLGCKQRQKTVTLTSSVTRNLSKGDMSAVKQTFKPWTFDKQTQILVTALLLVGSHQFALRFIRKWGADLGSIHNQSTLASPPPT